MQFTSIADIYSANEKVLGHFVGTLAGVSDDEAKARPDGEKWSIEQVTEHVAIVEHNMMRLCTKLIAAARAAGKPSDGRFEMTDDITARFSSIADVKVEAPERVHPAGGVTIAESLERLAATTSEIDAFRPDLEAFDGSDFKFPHPFFGELTAAEWLVVRVLHRARHTNQIKNILEKIRK